MQVTNKDVSVDTSAVVEGLKEGVEYEFRVTAENRAGPSQASAPSKPAKYGENNDSSYPCALSATTEWRCTCTCHAWAHFDYQETV